jgi:hypothetical protein
MLIAVEKRVEVERTVKLARPCPSSEVAVYGGRKAQPIECPDLIRRWLQAWVVGGCEETFRRNWWTSQDFTEKEAKSAVASSSMEWFLILIRICPTSSGTLAPLSTD